MNGFGCLLVGGPEYVIDVLGKDVRFEWHHCCGPMPVTNTGSEKKLGPRHMFWTVVTWWDRQGKRVENGRCVYDWPPHKTEVARHIIGNHWELTGDCKGFDLDDILKHGRLTTTEPR